MKSLITRLAALLIALGSQLPAFSQGTAFTYQGFLTSQGGPANGSFDLQFAVYDAAGGGSQQGATVQTNVVGITNGLFTVTIDPGANVFTGAARWLNIGVRPTGGAAFTNVAPRQALLSAPYAVRAASASSVNAANISGTIPLAQLPPAVVTNGASGVNFSGTFSGNGSALTNVDAATLNGLPASSFWKIGGNAGTSAGTHFLGTTDFQPVEFKSTGYRTLSLSYKDFFVVDSYHESVNVLGGYWANSINGNTGGAVIAGGGVSGYGANLIGNASHGSAIGGGIGNVIGNDAFACVISGGRYNELRNAEYSSVGSGLFNLLGNAAQSITRNAVIAGGRENVIVGDSQGAVISGGEKNAIGLKAWRSTIVGGYQNLISNNAWYATILGGSGNRVGDNADFSLAAGSSANANHAGVFVWSDSQAGTFASTAPNQFLIRASGGVGINTGSPGAMLQLGDVNTPNSEGMMRFVSRSGIGPSARQWDIGVPEGDQDTSGKYYSFVIDDTQNGSDPEFLIRWDTGNVGIGTTNPTAKLDVNGSYLKVSGAGNEQAYIGGDAIGTDIEIGSRNAAVMTAGFWNSAAGSHMNVVALSFVPTSDRNLKENFRAVDPQQVLAKVAALPISKWNFIGDAATPHVGPMAQDFHAAFGLGTDDKHIATVDADGVALAAIQGLNRKVDTETATLRAENAELKQRLAALEKLMKRLSVTQNGGGE